ncbi:MAG: hypothetical protein B6I34_03940 [Anaerolineaceae bacterium 4572_32.1]|nr:MAG: hypothetical protein B6I34_03940 [Anaerolineaceae bacterium 4572_32.1]
MNKKEYGQDLVIHTKLVLPRARRYLLQRPSLSARLLEAQYYRLTIVQAGTGYGKTTALTSALRDAPLRVFWYSITESDQDPLLFLLHLIYAFRRHRPDFGGRALEIIQKTEALPRPYHPIINALSNELVSQEGSEAILVLDDYHLVNASTKINAIVDYFLEVLPPHLHLIISSRNRPALKSLARRRVKGDLLEINRQDIAFSTDEIETLFRTQYGLHLDSQQVQKLTTETEGWIMALQMIWQGLQSGVAGDLDQILAELPRSLQDLFAYLAQEVLARRPARIQNFLLRTSVLRHLDAAACDCLLGWEGSESLLHELDAEGFFLVQQGSDYRYHHLFHDFLRQQAATDAERWRDLHRQAAVYFQNKALAEEAIYHWLAALEHERAAELMVRASESLIERLVDGQPNREEQARLLDLMAENMTNRGKWEEAKSLRKQAQEMREEGPGPADLDVRVLLRTGRLAKARRILEERAAAERVSPAHFREPRAHRETLLVLSLIYVWQGHAAEAFASAQEGIQIGQLLSSPFVEAVGYMRLGHAWQITEHPNAADRALSCYRQAMDIGERLAVPRTKAEALWGLCRLYGYGRDSAAAERSAREGIKVGLGAGDEWIVALIGVTLGASYVITGQHDEAEHWLERSAEAFHDCGDPFGQTVARLWQCLLYQHLDSSQLPQALQKMLKLIETNGYEFFFGRLTFLGPFDPPAMVPLLIAARKSGVRSAYATCLLERMKLSPKLNFHPGYTLRLHTLGQFCVYRGKKAIADSEWEREKARQLLQLLLANKERALPRDEIGAYLWPQADATAAERQFKVTLNALQHALEPHRPPRMSTLFVQRRGNTYGLNPAAPLWIDAAAFERLIAQGNEAQDEAETLDCYRQALLLYQGDFLPNCLYEDWCREERERLRHLYLTTAVKTAEILLAQNDLEETIRLGQQILTIDNCWEAAYQLLIRAYLRRRDRIQALRTYERCVTCLQEKLDVKPMPETMALYAEIKSAEP